MISLIAMALAGAALDARCSGQVNADPATNEIVGSSQVATKIGETYLAQMYGEETITRELPLQARLVHGIWHVTGKPLMAPKLGGVGEIEICQSTGRVLRIYHGE